jgi:hypothetical protein
MSPLRIGAFCPVSATSFLSCSAVIESSASRRVIVGSSSTSSFMFLGGAVRRPLLTPPFSHAGVCGEVGQFQCGAPAPTDVRGGGVFERRRQCSDDGRIPSGSPCPHASRPKPVAEHAKRAETCTQDLPPIDLRQSKANAVPPRSRLCRRGSPHQKVAQRSILEKQIPQEPPR